MEASVVGVGARNILVDIGAGLLVKLLQDRWGGGEGRGVQLYIPGQARGHSYTFPLLPYSSQAFAIVQRCVCLPALRTAGTCPPSHCPGPPFAAAATSTAGSAGQEQHGRRPGPPPVVCVCGGGDTYACFGSRTNENNLCGTNMQ